MIQRAKVYSEEIPFFELLNSKFDSEGIINRIKNRSLNFIPDSIDDFSGYLNFIEKPSNRILFDNQAKSLRFGDSKTVRITSFYSANGILRVGYMPSRYSIYRGFSEIIDKSVDYEGLDSGIVGNRLLANHCGAGVFIDCRRGGSGSDANDRVLIGMRPNSEVIDTHRLFRTYSASGSADLSDSSPFETIKRETQEEINYYLDTDKTELISFGYDSQLGYFQFSFYHKSDLDFSDIANLAADARDSFEYDSLDLITFSDKELERAVVEIALLPWEPSALYSLIILFSGLIAERSSDIGEYKLRVDNFRRDLECEILKNNNNEKSFKIFI
jgi:8-oxo-dGTP pyrophosphatase MutT (NUDIX family)